MKEKPHLVEINNPKGAFCFLWLETKDFAMDFINSLQKNSNLTAYYRGDFTEIL